jgi:hypothetical protein
MLPWPAERERWTPTRELRESERIRGVTKAAQKNQNPKQKNVYSSGNLIFFLWDTIGVLSLFLHHGIYGLWYGILGVWWMVGWLDDWIDWQMVVGVAIFRDIRDGSHMTDPFIVAGRSSPSYRVSLGSFPPPLLPLQSRSLILMF